MAGVDRDVVRQFGADVTTAAKSALLRADQRTPD
jgi:hypothetical protein